MRTIIAGSRDGATWDDLLQAIGYAGWTPTVVLSGTARGVDRMGEVWATTVGRVPLEKYPADWDRYGKAAGYRRNEQMAEKAEALLALWDGESRGTKHMIDIATAKGLRVYVYRIAK